MFRRIAPHLLLIGMVLALVMGSAPALAQDPTIPTRTPTPDPNAATSVPPTSAPPPSTSVPPTADSGGGSPATAVPTATSDPATGNPPAAATATTAATTGAAAPGVTPGATVTTGTGGEVAPGGTFVVQECGTQPYVAAIRDVIVFTGPGIDYPVLSTLQRPEIRPIIGRAEFAPWWYIQLTPDLTGWVADSGVDEFGDTGGVPLVDIPAVNGIEPTRGALWQPTPIPFAACTATPTPSPSPSPTATAAADAPEAVVSAVDGTNGGGSEGEQPEAVSVADITAAGGRGEAEFESNSGGAGAKQLQDAELAIAEVTGGQTTTSTPLSGLLFPLLGLGLVAAGLALAFVARSRNAATASGTDADENTSD